jgi:hypothetical protein
MRSGFVFCILIFEFSVSVNAGSRLVLLFVKRALFWKRKEMTKFCQTGPGHGPIKEDLFRNKCLTEKYFSNRKGKFLKKREFRDCPYKASCHAKRWRGCSRKSSDTSARCLQATFPAVSGIKKPIQARRGSTDGNSQVLEVD